VLRTLAKNSSLIAACAAILLLSLSAQTPQNSKLTARVVIERFNGAFNRHDADALAPLLTDDTVFEDTSPAPDGQGVYHKIRNGQPWHLRGVDVFTVRRESCGETRIRERMTG
jgi:ketosteroid isomerase-like protein